MARRKLKQARAGTCDGWQAIPAHAVLIDYRALPALKHSALSLDIYTWLAHRLCRIDKFSGVMLSWQNRGEQFGPEYVESKEFRRESRDVLRQVTVAMRPIPATAKGAAGKPDVRTEAHNPVAVLAFL